MANDWTVQSQLNRFFKNQTYDYYLKCKDCNKTSHIQRSSPEYKWWVCNHCGKVHEG